MPPKLSPRELQVLRELAEGKDTHGIAAALKIAPATVRVHTTHLLDKCGMHTRAGAVAVGFRESLLV